MIEASRDSRAILRVVAERISELLGSFEYAYRETEHDDLFQSLTAISENLLHCVLALLQDWVDDANAQDSLSVASTYLRGVGHVFAAMQALGDSVPGKWAGDCRAKTLRLLERVTGETHPASLVHLTEFPIERQLNNFIVDNLPTMPGHKRPLALFNADGKRGVEYQTGVGRIDILAIANDALYVIELKRGAATDKALSQLLRYMGWVRMHIAQGRAVFGVIIGASISESLRYAVAAVSNVHLLEYDFAFSLHSVPGNGFA
ncbi:endonuclease NucS domain-containing protein [Paraburkholderia solisilvae]|uniref:Endonuclease NucS n=1 Tax=Paraburkholderia solisilvae TaxID=624376 RepID=A0A6J5EVA8_9BURK|nr:endonuclease NucS domain-containing protein [Paraburkholderia solisilvae]CAB3770510.1 Endonuclease NucS [Paraburkholderia solisilvae]